MPFNSNIRNSSQISGRRKIEAVEMKFPRLQYQVRNTEVRQKVEMCGAKGKIDGTYIISSRDLYHVIEEEKESSIKLAADYIS
jgi:hypothetical protein